MICLVCNNNITPVYTFGALFEVSNTCLECKENMNVEYKKIEFDCVYEYSKVMSMCLYNDYNKQIIERIKMGRDILLLSIYKKDIRKLVKKYFYDYIVVPVPISNKRMIIREFNQAFEIAKFTGLKIYDCFERIDESTHSQKSKYERIHNKPKFRLKHDLPKNNKILIVDDIYVTGITVNCIALLLEEYAPSDISVLTVFYA